MMKRDECFRVLARHVTDEAVVATYSSAVDWVAVAPRPLNYLSIGAMGLDSSHGLGLALGRPDKRVLVLQGDGSLLMNLGSLVTIAAVAPKNFVHLVAHNETYEANGGHPIPAVRKWISPALARAAGYAAVYDFSDLDIFTQQVATRARTGRAGLRHAACRAVKTADLRLCEPLRSGKTRSLQSGVAGGKQRANLALLLQPAQHFIELIEVAIADAEHAAAAAIVDADGKAERIGYALFQRNQIGVLFRPRAVTYGHWRRPLRSCRRLRAPSLRPGER